MRVDEQHGAPVREAEVEQPVVEVAAVGLERRAARWRAGA